MDSFYGGKQGRSYKIVARFDSIKDMVDAFRQGGSYTDVTYDEYVIIDTILNKHEKNNVENGLLYRRGYNYSEQFNPNGIILNNNTLSSDAEKEAILYFNDYNQEYTYTDDNHLTEGTYSISVQIPIYYDFTYKVNQNNECDITRLINSFKVDNWDENWVSFVTHPGGGAIYIGQIVGPQGDTPAIEIIDWDNLQGLSFKEKIQVSPKPGYDEEAQGTDGYDSEGFHDEIQYGYCLIKDSQGNITGTYLAFDIPYTVFNIQAEAIEPYNIPSNLIIEQTDSEGHPYYKHYKVQVPKGIHGQDITDIIVQRGTNNNFELSYKYKNYETSSNPEEQSSSSVIPLDIAEFNNIAFDNDIVLLQFKNHPDEGSNFYNATIGQTYLYQNSYWIPLGNLYNGTHSFRNFENVNVLTSTYPYGLGKTTQNEDDPSTMDYKGWVVTVGNNTDGYSLYAYDYSDPTKGWYPIKDLGADMIEAEYSVLLAEPKVDANDKPDVESDVLNNNGLWFVITK